MSDKEVKFNRFFSDGYRSDGVKPPKSNSDKQANIFDDGGIFIPSKSGRKLTPKSIFEESNEFEGIVLGNKQEAEEPKEPNKPKILISNEQINNEVYKSEVSYRKIMTEDNVTIVNKENLQHVILVYDNLLKKCDEKEKEFLLNIIKDLPAEVLNDIAYEVSFGRVKAMEGSEAAYTHALDEILVKGGKIFTRDKKEAVQTLVHEVGHAIDCVGKGKDSYYQSDKSKAFKAAFESEMENFLKDGYNRRWENGFHGFYAYSQDENKNACTYCTYDEQEMFAECYCLLMLGYCQSKEVILKYFPKTLNCALNIVENSRTLNIAQRY